MNIPARGRIIAAMAFAFLLLSVAACKKEQEEVAKGYLPAAMPVTFDEERAAAISPERCAECHREAYEAWRGSDHDLANRTFATPVRGPDGQLLPNLRDDAPLDGHAAAGVLGVRPLVQFIIAHTNGRYQAHHQAWDVEKHEWFSVFGHEQRTPDEWGHWLGQGMNWNSNCAYCHMTEYKKNYDFTSNSYSTTWVHQGITCAQCHPNSASHSDAAEKGVREYVETLDMQVVMENCASCHSRREELTPNDFKIGERYHDHFGLVLPDQPGAYYPDGQVREEDYAYASLRLSRMGHAGVTCMDCHEPHSLQTILPTENNALCMRCHSGGLMDAPIINPEAHSRHQPGSTGNRCIECHMPATPFMSRDWRRDHGFTSPDPLLTKQMGIPNACNACHDDQSVDWALQHTKEWYGEDFNADARARALLLHAFNSETTLNAGDLVAQARAEENHYWLAVWLRLLGRVEPTPESIAFAREMAQHETPIVRDAALRALAQDPGAADAFTDALDDPARVVRVTAAGTLGPQGAAGSPALDDYRTYLEMNADRPSPAFLLAQWEIAEGDTAAAFQLVRNAISFDPANPAVHFEAALFFLEAGRADEAEKHFKESVRLSPDSGYFAYQYALFLVETGRMDAAAQWMRAATEREPGFHRAYYNLSVMDLQKGDFRSALEWIDQALHHAPSSPDYQQTRLYILNQMQRLP